MRFRRSPAPAEPPAGAGLPPATDGALVRRALGGERGAFGQLYERHGQRVFRYMFFRTRDEDLAYDLTHDAFVSALKALPTLRDPEHFDRWLLRIAHNQLVNHWAQQAARAPGMRSEERGDEGRTVLGHASAASSLDRDPTIGAGADAIEQVDHRLRLEALVAGKLNETQQQVLSLRFAAGLPLRDVAAIVGCSEDAAKQHQYRALRLLRARLAGEEAAP